MSFPLNPAQKAAVEHGAGPALVLAGAGSGKTRVITQRIQRLLDVGVLARGVTAVTFTNKAAEEMRERLVHACGPRGKDVWISTFHALGGEIVRREMRDRFVIYDGADTSGVVKEILRDIKAADRRFDAAAIVSRISFAKNAMASPDDLPEDGEYDEITRLVYPRYEATLKRLRALDFDDLILWPLRRLTEDEEVRARWRRQIHYMLVDEFQDTNRAQLLLVKALVGPGGNVFCVGDDDQSIYGWRGADISNVIDFPKHFPGAKTLALEQNYRSRRPVLDLANAVMEGQVRAFPKRLFTDRPGGDAVKVVTCDSGDGEVKFCLQAIQKLLTNGYRRREIGVLYRSNLLGRAVEEALRLAGIPYRIIGGTSVYERREVKDLLAYLRLALHPEDEIAFRRVVNYPARGIGDVTFERLERRARARGATLFQAAESAREIPGLSANARDAFKHFTELLKATRTQVTQGVQLGTVARNLAAAISLREDILDAGPSPAVAAKRWSNVEFLFKMLEKAGETTAGEANAVLARLTLRFSEEEEEVEERVTLSTLHGSKGLEFGTVFFIGCDEGIIPHSRTDAPKATDVLATIDAGEERRLFYVGVTRAKETLYLVRARTRSNRGPARATIPSRFIQQLPRHLYETMEFDSQAVLSPTELAAHARKLRESLMARRTAG